MALTKVDKSVSSTPGIVDNSDATAITITSAEDVGIGTSSPTTFSGFKTLHLKNGSGDALMLIESDGGIISQNIVSDSASVVTVGSRSNHAYRITTNDVERMRIDTSGNVGIGTSIPAGTLHIYTTSGNVATVMQTAVNGAASSSNYITPNRTFYTGVDIGGVNSSWTVYDGSAFSERIRIDSSGEIHINKTATINNGQLEVLAQTNHQAIVAKVQTDSYNNFLGYNSSGQVTCYIQGNGNYYFSGTNQSDRDLKENIQSITESSLEKVKQLEPKTFNFKESEGFQTNKKTGFIAQEVAEIFGTENGVATGTDGKKDMGIDSVGLIAHLTKAIQEQQAIINDLKARIEVLEA